MRILHVFPFLGVGGTEIATRRIIDGVRPFGIESRALLLRPTAELTEYLHDAGIPCAVADPVPEPSIRHGVSFLRQSRALARSFGDVDLVHCADVLAAYYTALAGRLAGVPVLTHVRNRLPALPRRDRLFIGASTHFAFVSASTRDQFPMQIPKARTTIVYDGIDPAENADLAEREEAARAVRTEFGIPPDAAIASMFARINPQKDYETLVRAAAILRRSHPRLRLVIVGDFQNVANNRQHYAQVRRLIAEAGVDDQFLFAGFREDTRRIMLASDICVLCTNFEGLPLVILEAMSLGRPCVATSVDGIPEALDHGRTGLLHRHRDADDLAGCLARLLDDITFAERLGAAGREEVRQRFGNERFSRDMHALYQRLAGGRQCGGAQRSDQITTQAGQHS